MRILVNSVSYILTSVLGLGMSVAVADTVINNYGTSNNEPQQQQQQEPQNQQNAQNNNNNNIDPRIPPAGAYSVTHSDGSSEQLYTTGQKQPYYVDNPNSQSSTPQQVFVQPTIPMPSPNPPRQ